MLTHIRFFLICLLILSAQFAFLIPVSAASRAFDANQIITENELTLMPKNLSSADRIQAYLESQGSVLATYQVPITFEPDDIIISSTNFQNLPTFLQPRFATQPYYGTNMRVSDFIWQISRGDMGNGCSLGNNNICVNNRLKTLNPAFVLAKIQKEQGLVRGSCARVGAQCYGQTMESRLDRAMGYTCTGGLPEKSCYDVNPNWKYFKGLFRQVYYAMRLLRLYSQFCDNGGYQIGGTLHKTGNSYTYTGYPNNPTQTTVTYQNGITCSLYIYTPYVDAQSLLFSVLDAVGFDQILIAPDTVENIEINVPIVTGP